MTSAVVFAYHNVGVRCLAVLLAHGFEVPLVITHEDELNENIWFDNVAELAALHEIPLITPHDPNAPEIVARVKSIQPDFIFSFYYRQILKAEVLSIPRCGALNMHGSLLPKYRGRAPINWAILKGEKETGATLHYMSEKPDQGPVIDQQAVPILPNDNAITVFNKVTVAAEVTLDRCLPTLITGTAKTVQQDSTKGSYFGGRHPEDGRIDWSSDALTIHNLIRAVAPPYPGAFTRLINKPMRISASLIEPKRISHSSIPSFYCEADRCYAQCRDGKVLRILAFELDGVQMTPKSFIADFGTAVYPFG